MRRADVHMLDPTCAHVDTTCPCREGTRAHVHIVQSMEHVHMCPMFFVFGSDVLMRVTDMLMWDGNVLMR